MSDLTNFRTMLNSRNTKYIARGPMPQDSAAAETIIELVANDNGAFNLVGPAFCEFVFDHDGDFIDMKHGYKVTNISNEYV